MYRDVVKRGVIVGYVIWNFNLIVDVLVRYEEKYDEEGDFVFKDEEGLIVKSG